ncbi:Os06g0235500, partial [Oryza sativa Japonica Group]
SIKNSNVNSLFMYLPFKSIAASCRLLDGQKKQANVSPDSPVYLSLRPDSRVRGSDVGYPPWQAFVAQLPPVKGMWSDLLNGMDGRVSPWASNRPWRAGS